MTDLPDQVRQLVASETLCDHCLGRCFARQGTGLTNEERGRALRVVLAMSEDREIEEPGSCSICRGGFETVGEWAARAAQRARGYEFQTYLCGTRLPSEIEEAERALWARRAIDPGQAEPLKQEFNREVGRRFGQLLASQGRDVRVDFQEPEIALLIDLERDQLDMTVNPLFLYGRYRKLVRGIPQTKWPCRRCRGRGCPECAYTGKQYPESVEELIAGPVIEATGGEGHAFHGAGREDVDARMLGTGRPFVLEIAAPRRRRLDPRSLEQEINARGRSKVEVSRLRRVKRRAVSAVKALDAEKSYRARVTFDMPVAQAKLDEVLESLVGEIRQRTPERVAHRRTDRVRVRRVYEIRGELVGDEEAMIEARCDGGLYVKELFSGDDGRTRPSVAERLGVGARVVELDVLGIHGDLDLSQDMTDR